MKQCIDNENGIALFLVLWVLVLLSVIVGEFCYVMRTEVNITRNFKESTQAYYIATAGLNRAIVELVRNVKIPPMVNDAESDEAETEQRLRVNTDIPPVAFGEGRFKVRVAGESGKININTANTRLLKMMLSKRGLEDEERDVIVDSIFDWRDKDHLHRINGAEDEYYKSLPEPYECRDGDFMSIGELRLVKGVTPALYYGGLEKIVTVYTDDSDAKGKKKKPSAGKVNINAADHDMLMGLPLMTEELVSEIIDYRKTNDFKSLSELSEILDLEVYNAVKPYLTTRTLPYYTVTSMGMIGDSKTRRGVEAIVKIDARAKKGYRILRWLDDIPGTGFSEPSDKPELGSRDGEE